MKRLPSTKTDDGFMDTIPSKPMELGPVETVPGALWAQVDGEDGQCSVCVTENGGSASMTLNTKTQRISVQFSDAALLAIAAILSAARRSIRRKVS